MSELRKSTTLVSEEIIVATERGMKPDDFKVVSDKEKILQLGLEIAALGLKPEQVPSYLAEKEQRELAAKIKACPFCPGNESQTPTPELLRIIGTAIYGKKIRQLNLTVSNRCPQTEDYSVIGDPWDLRVVPNKYRAASIEGKNVYAVNQKISRTILDMHGAHEVVIENTDHNQEISQYDVSKIVNLLTAIVARTQDLYCDRKIKHIQVFKNSGRLAGASLEHPHTQLIGLTAIPKKLQRRVGRLREYYEDEGHSVFETLIERNIEENRLVDSSQHFVCLCPYESRFPFEMWILPRANVSRLCKSQENFWELAQLIQASFWRLRTLLGYLPPYNFVLDEVPFSLPGIFEEADEFYRWRWRLFPRLTYIAGFELGSGMYINPLPPENAAKYLREAKS